MKPSPKTPAILSVVVLTACCLFLLFLNSSIYTANLNIAQLENRYNNSQYAKTNSYKYYIDDPELYTYAGWRQALGVDPTTVNFEHQPLAKYVIGLSILVFGNAAVGQLLIAWMCLVLTYFLSRKVLPGLLACLPVILLTFDPLFEQQSAQAYLDVYQLAATLVLFLCVLSADKKPMFTKLAIVALALVCLTNSVWSGLFTSLVVAVFVFIKQRELVKKYVTASLWGILVYVLGYSVYFRSHSALDFFRLHLAQLRFYRSYVPDYPKGEVFRIIFTGQWRKWFGDFGLMPASPYSVLWPVSLALSLIGVVTGKLRKISSPELLLLLWVTGWLVFISLKIVFPRYLLVILPMLYILSVSTVYNLYNKYHDNRH